MFLFIVFPFLIQTVCSYDPSLGLYFANLAQSTYCVSSPSEWNCQTCEPSIKPDYVVENNGVRAIQGYDSQTNSLFTAFRGSSNIQNWLDNIKISKVTPYNDTTISVEKGFYKAYSDIKEDLLNNLVTLASKHNTHSMEIVGHSLGAALATLFAYDLTTLKQEFPIKTLYTYGSPRVGNPSFVHSFESYNIPSFRVTHHYDMVPHVPEELLGYLHISNEIWYTENNNAYNVCNDLYGSEDNSCSNSCSPTHCTSTSDHLYYLNVTMGNDPCK